ncbi:hypothetical protein MRX96_041272 [Rhipicephalus microplus]
MPVRATRGPRVSSLAVPFHPGRCCARRGRGSRQSAARRLSRCCSAERGPFYFARETTCRTRRRQRIRCGAAVVTCDADGPDPTVVPRHVRQTGPVTWERHFPSPRTPVIRE